MNKNEIKSKYMIIEGIVSVIVNILLFAFKYAVGIFSGSLSIIADAWHHRSDSITSIIILGGILIGKNFWQLDGILSIIVSIVIFIEAFDVIKSSIKPLIGEYPSEEIINKIKNIAKELNLNSESLHHFHIHIYGAHTEITFHIRFPKDMTVFEAHNMATLLENEIREKLFIEATIHIEAY